MKESVLILAVAGLTMLVFWVTAVLRSREWGKPGAVGGVEPLEMPPPLPVVAEGEVVAEYRTPEVWTGLRPPGASSPRGAGTWWCLPVDLMLATLVMMIFVSLTALSAASGGEEKTMEVKPANLMVAMVFQGTLAAMVVAFVWKRVRVIEWLGLNWRQAYHVFWIAPVAVVGMWVTMGVLHATGWNQWLEQAVGAEQMQDSVKLLKETKDPLVLVLMSLAAVVVAPVAEEVVFRGYLYPAMKHFTGEWGGVVLSSLIFSVVHGSAVALVPLFLLAVVLCLLYQRTGSLWSAIGVHFLFNAGTVAIQLLMRANLIPAEPPV